MRYRSCLGFFKEVLPGVMDKGVSRQDSKRPREGAMLALEECQEELQAAAQGALRAKITQSLFSLEARTLGCHIPGSLQKWKTPSHLWVFPAEIENSQPPLGLSGSVGNDFSGPTVVLGPYNITGASCFLWVGQELASWRSRPVATCVLQ